MPPLLPQPNWTVYAQSADPQVHPLGPPPVPRGADGRPAAALSWVTGIGADHGVLRTLGVHTADEEAPASLTTWRHTGDDEPALDAVSCLRRDLRFHLGPSAAATVPAATEERFVFADVETSSVVTRHAGMTWRSLALDSTTVTLAHHDDSPSLTWERR